jgi:hypothetical protein
MHLDSHAATPSTIPRLNGYPADVIDADTSPD